MYEAQIIVLDRLKNYFLYRQEIKPLPESTGKLINNATVPMCAIRRINFILAISK
jgi:hypothetical protein